MRDRPLTPPRLIDGVRDTLAVIASLDEPRRMSPDSGCFKERLVEFHTSCNRAIGGSARDVSQAVRRLRRRARELAAAAPVDHPELREWTRALVRQCGAAQRDLCRLAFWTLIPAIGTGKRRFWDVRDDILLTADQRQALKGLSAAIDAMDAHCTLGQLPAAATRVAEDAEALLPAGPDSAGRDQPLPRKLAAKLSRIAVAARGPRRRRPLNCGR